MILFPALMNNMVVWRTMSLHMKMTMVNFVNYLSLLFYCCSVLPAQMSLLCNKNRANYFYVLCFLGLRCIFLNRVVGFVVLTFGLGVLESCFKPWYFYRKFHFTVNYV